VYNYVRTPEVVEIDEVKELDASKLRTIPIEFWIF
jgi:hypothetical protein